MTDPLSRLSAALADRYRIDGEVGAGGMATVYRAHDIRHDRGVAIKVLHPDLGAALGSERFLSEIKTTAKLQHPHILPLLDSGEADGLLYYVMPVVLGETLGARLKRERQLPIPEAVRIAREVASALDYAHRQGVIHRDIKPENILLHDGSALVADFGIALAVQSAGGPRMTQTGLSLGTPQYMSPEQAMGETNLDARTDIYALGAVTYEMLAGDAPFSGSSAQAIVARVLSERPTSLGTLRDTVPPELEDAVLTALAKLPADRFATAAQFADALARAQPLSTRTSTPGRTRSVSRDEARAPVTQRALRALPWALATAGIAASAWLVTHQPQPVPTPTVHFTLTFGRDAALVEEAGASVAFSPDGSQLAYVGRDSVGQQLFLRDLDRVEPVPIPGTANATMPFFSPDGLWLAFHQEGRLRKVALAGGSVVTICDAPGYPSGASWGEGDVIVFSVAGVLQRVSGAGGEPTVIATPDRARGEAYRFPELLPDGRAVVFAAVNDSGPSLRAITLADNVVTSLNQRGLGPRYVDGGHLVYTEADGTLFAAPFDAGRLRITGPPEPVASNVRLIEDNLVLGTAPAPRVAVARSGALAFLTGSGGQSELVVYDRDGRASLVSGARNEYHSPRFSPDGERIAVTVVALSSIATAGTLGDTWVWSSAGQRFQRITSDTLTRSAEWSQDGRRLIYARGPSPDGSDVNTIASDGSGVPEQLLTRPGAGVFELSLTPDGRRAVFRETVGPPTGQDIWIAPLESGGVATLLLVTPSAERNPAVSPDGRWLAYASNESGEMEVYVRSLNEGGDRTRVSNRGGAEPRWPQSGRELFYRTPDSVYVVPILQGQEFRAGAPRALFGGNFPRKNTTNWDVSRDGQGFVMVRPPVIPPEGPPLHVLLNWFDRVGSAPR